MSLVATQEAVQHHCVIGVAEGGAGLGPHGERPRRDVPVDGRPGKGPPGVAGAAGLEVERGDAVTHGRVVRVGGHHVEPGAELVEAALLAAHRDLVQRGERGRERILERSAENPGVQHAVDVVESALDVGPRRLEQGTETGVLRDAEPLRQPFGRRHRGLGRRTVGTFELRADVQQFGL